MVDDHGSDRSYRREPIQDKRTYEAGVEHGESSRHRDHRRQIADEVRECHREDPERMAGGTAGGPESRHVKPEKSSGADHPPVGVAHRAPSTVERRGDRASAPVASRPVTTAEEHCSRRRSNHEQRNEDRDSCVL